MSACELCWNQAWLEARYGPESQVEAYHRVLRENEGKLGHQEVPLRFAEEGNAQDGVAHQDGDCDSYTGVIYGNGERVIGE